MVSEQHPLGFFLPENTKLLMLGSFPPPRARWSMNFYYPNIQNDMWRILGLIFYNDKEYFLETKRLSAKKKRKPSAGKKGSGSVIPPWRLSALKTMPRIISCRLSLR